MSDCLEGQPDLLPICAELRGIDQDAGEPPIGLPVGGDRHELDPRKLAQGRSGRSSFILLRRSIRLVQSSELCPTESGEQIAEPVVVADDRVFVVGERLTGLGGQVAGAVDQVGRLGSPTSRHRWW